MNPTTKKLTHSALMIALALVLSMIKPIHMPYGGSITIASMAPIILIALKYDFKWGIFTALTYSIVQMIEGFYPPPVQNLGAYLAVILLDYIIAFGVLGCAGFISRRFKNKKTGATVAAISVIAARFTCSFLSGVIIWKEYAPEGMPVWLYSLGYNGFICIGETVFTVVALLVAIRYLPIEKL